MAFFRRNIIQIHHKMRVFISCLHVLPSRFEVVHFGFFHRLDSPEYGRSSEYYGTSSRKYGWILYDQSYLVFIITQDLWYLHSDHHVPQGLGMLPRHSVNQNVPRVIVEILDRACYQASHFQELQRDAVHAGPRINKDGG